MSWSCLFGTADSRLVNLVRPRQDGDDILARVPGQKIVRRGRPFPEYRPLTITK